MSAGPVSDRLAGATHHGLVDAAAPGRYLLRLPTVGSFLAQHADGRTHVTVEPADGAAPADVACLLAGPVRQACWLLRGGFALRGCGVVIGGRAVAILGGPAAGKSAVTAALARRGHPILADGALPVRPDSVAEPADDGVHVWPEAAAQLGLDPADGEVIRPGLAKRRYRFDAARATPLAAVVLLRRHADVGDPTAAPVRGLAALEALAGCTAMRPLIAPFGATAAHFAWAARVAGSARVVDLHTDRHRRDLPAVADAIEALAVPPQ